ncbi:MAG TPA: hypothetical protein VFH91_01365 [Pyrinomonadaceae bacterium]|nr:hypothetical protein [Pyrinomonadaceae bacterium]
MKERIVLTVVVCLVSLAYDLPCKGQADDELKRFEAAVLFSSITKPEFSGTTADAGFGGRLTFNLNRSIALETEGIFFPSRCTGCRPENRGRLTQFFAGVKAGKRFDQFGIFFKARPGLASFSDGGNRITFIPIAAGQFPFIPLILFDSQRKTNFATDLGVAVEIYHSKRIFTRFDAGDTIIRYSDRQAIFFNLDPAGNVFPVQVKLPNKTLHNFQFSASVGFRF